MQKIKDFPLWRRNLWILWFTQVIAVSSFGFGIPFIPLYIQTLQNLDSEKVKILSTILVAAPAIGMGVMAPIWGYLADRFGRKLMMMRALFAGIFILGLMGMVTNVGQLIFLRTMQGLLTGTITAAFAFVAANTPEDKLSEAIGVISSSTFIGFSLGPVLGGLFAEAYGYRISFFLGSALIFIAFLSVLIFVKEDRQIFKETKSKDGIIKKYRSVIAPTIVVILLMLLVLRVTRTMFSPYLAIFVEGKFTSKSGVSSTTGLINGLIGICTAFSSIKIGKYIATHSRIKVLSWLVFISLIVAVLLSQYAAIAQILGIGQDLYAFIALYMLFYLVVGGIEPILTSTAAMQVAPQDRGALSGLQGMLGSFGWFIAPTISGFVAYGRSVDAVLYILPVVIFINLSLSFLLKSKERQRISKEV